MPHIEGFAAPAPRPKSPASRPRDNCRLVLVSRMLDQPDRTGATEPQSGPARDFQDHLAALEAAGLLVRVDRPIDKDSELHPLVRWQFQGGLAEDQRRAFLFTNVVDGSGRR